MRHDAIVFSESKLGQPQMAACRVVCRPDPLFLTDQSCVNLDMGSPGSSFEFTFLLCMVLTLAT